jgi:hypothetical protein
MSEPAEPTRVEMSEATATALRKRGGSLYVWEDAAGMIRTSTNPPPESLLYDTFTGEGWAVHVDREIVPPPRWVIKRQRLPWPRFRALINPLDRHIAEDAGDGLLTGWRDLRRL